MAKIQDYKVEDYPEKLKWMINHIDDIAQGKAFTDEMSRFIPMDVQERTLKKAKFLEFLANEDKGLLLEVEGFL